MGVGDTGKVTRQAVLYLPTALALFKAILPLGAADNCQESKYNPNQLSYKIIIIIIIIIIPNGNKVQK